MTARYCRIRPEACPGTLGCLSGKPLQSDPMHRIEQQRRGPWLHERRVRQIDSRKQTPRAFPGSVSCERENPSEAWVGQKAGHGRPPASRGMEARLGRGPLLSGYAGRRSQQCGRGRERQETTGISGTELRMPDAPGNAGGIGRLPERPGNM